MAQEVELLRELPPDAYYGPIDLIDNVALYGGFDGTETLRQQRNWQSTETLIIGDGVNSVVRCWGQEAFGPCGDNAIIDGFSITDGNYEVGGGMDNEYASPMVSNCTFYYNGASLGGGLYNYYASPIINNCTFMDNMAENGGGMYNDFSSPVITNSRFLSNNAGYGGGMGNESSSPTISNCTFNGNSAEAFGGMGNYGDASPTVSNCVFEDNSGTPGEGGGMGNVESASPTVTNSIFMKNTGIFGGGMYNGSTATVINCTFAENKSKSGDGIYNEGTLTLTNSILWDISGVAQYYNSGTATVTYSDVQGAGLGGTNIDEDPLFEDASIGLLRLTCVPAEACSPCIDTANDAVAPPGDINGNGRVDIADIGLLGTLADMGAYEFHP